MDMTASLNGKIKFNMSSNLFTIWKRLILYAVPDQEEETVTSLASLNITELSTGLFTYYNLHDKHFDYSIFHFVL